LEKTRGSISWLIKHRQENISEYFEENQLIDLENDKKLIVVSDPPGMGKSTLTTSLAIQLKRKNPCIWVFRIDLVNFSNFFSDKKTFDDSCPITFLLEMLNSYELMKTTPFENALIYRSLQTSGNIALLFDGFDEISPTYKEIVLKLVTAIREHTKFQKIIITTRPHVQKELEVRLNIFSSQMKPLSELEQLDCLEKIWAQYFETADEKDQGNQYKRLKTHVKSVMEKLSFSLADRDTELTGVPLQISLIAEAFGTNSGKEGWEGCQEYLLSTDDRPPKLPEKFDLVGLYDLFVERKFFDIYCKDKLKRDSSICGNKEEQEKAFHEFILEHQILAVSRIFPEDVKKLLSKDEQGKIEPLKKAIDEGTERRGIINQIINDEPHFVHLTFAEYFAAKYLFQNLAKMVKKKVKQIYWKKSLLITGMRSSELS